MLENPGLRAGYVKIGCSTRSGFARARDLNRDANTGTPGEYRCVFELHTQDCGSAERRVFAILAGRRRGKPGQEFFEVSLEDAERAIRDACARQLAHQPARAQPAAEPEWPPHPVTQQAKDGAASAVFTHPRKEVRNLPPVEWTLAPPMQTGKPIRNNPLPPDQLAPWARHLGDDGRIDPRRVAYTKKKEAQRYAYCLDGLFGGLWRLAYLALIAVFASGGFVFLLFLFGIAKSP